MRHLESHKHFYNLKVKGGYLITTSKADFLWMCREEDGAIYTTRIRLHHFTVNGDNAVRVEHVHTLDISA